MKKGMEQSMPFFIFFNEVCLKVCFSESPFSKTSLKLSVFNW